MSQYEIRADYDKETIVVYQAYNEQIASLAVQNKRFVPPFSFNRMTWIKPSFLWMMERCDWGQKPNQERVLAVRLYRKDWEDALSQAVLTTPESRVYSDAKVWREMSDKAKIHIQWDPERSIRGAKLDHRSIQVGISRHLTHEYATKWIADIQDYTPLVKRLHALCQKGNFSKASDILPHEKKYEIPDKIKKCIGAD